MKEKKRMGREGKQDRKGSEEYEVREERAKTAETER